MACVIDTSVLSLTFPRHWSVTLLGANFAEFACTMDILMFLTEYFTYHEGALVRHHVLSILVKIFILVSKA